MLSANETYFEDAEFSLDDLAFIDDVIMRVAHMAQYTPNINGADKDFTELNLSYLSGIRKYREYMLKKLEQG